MLVFVPIGAVQAQDRVVSGKITSSDDGSPLPGVNVVLKGTTQGTITDIEGNFKINVSENGGILVFSFIGLATQEVELGSRSVVDVSMEPDARQLGEVVVTSLGENRGTRTLPFASQQVKAENLNITQDSDIKAALAGKVAGVSIAGQAGSKLGEFGKIRIRGALSLTNDSGPLYVVDGVPVSDPNDVDMNNVESVNVLKGPNATALYGQRAEAGVVIITTKKGSQGLAVEIISTTTWDKVGFLPKYQNKYGIGYDGDDSFGTFDFNGGVGPYGPYPAEWSVFDGKRYILYDNNYADESWGPRLDGQEYVPWYAWWPESPYFGQTAKYSPQPGNIKDFYQTGISGKNTVAVSGGNDNYNIRLSYSNLDQKGITPFTHYGKHFITSNVEFSPTKRLKIISNIRYSNSKTKGDFDDGYGNQTTGSFSSWFNRNLDMSKLRELSDLKTLDGYTASWNWWGPDYYTIGSGYVKPAFWYNPFTFMEHFTQTGINDNLAGGLNAVYKITEEISLAVAAQRNVTEYKFDWRFPFVLANSAAPELYNSWINSFGKYRRTEIESNYFTTFTYVKNFADFDINAMVGGNIRTNSYSSTDLAMNPGAKTGGLIIPDVYTFSNAGIVPVPVTYDWQKQVNSLYGRLSVGYRYFLYLDATYRKDWSSALPATRNGYGYPSVGGSFVFSELLDRTGLLTFGKVRVSWAQVGNDVDAIRINPTFSTGTQPFMGTNILMYNPTRIVDPNIMPSLNTSIETGFDVRALNNRVGANFTYYNERRKDEIIPVSISQGTGYVDYLTNAGESMRRGVEVSVDGDIFKRSNSLNWNIAFNIGTYNTTVEALPGDLTAINGTGSGVEQTGTFSFISVIHELGSKWGQLRGTAIARDEKGNPIIQPSGLYKTESSHYFGSVIPDFSGGVVNRLSYGGLSLAVSFDFQKGGKFFSLTEQWGTASGLLQETAADNNLGHNVRDALEDGGGVHVVGVDENGAKVDTYVDAHTYWSQWYSNRLAEPFIHDKSYVKLRDVSLSYDFSKLLHSEFIKGATIGLVGRNLWLIAVARDNKHRWDPSILSQNYGENGQLPGTRSYGVNLKLSF